MVHLVVVYGFQGAEEDPDQLLLADKLLQAVLAEAQVVCIGQPLLIAGDLNADPAVIPCLAKGISARKFVDLAFAYSLGAGVKPDATCKFSREDGVGLRRDFIVGCPNALAACDTCFVSDWWFPPHFPAKSTAPQCAPGCVQAVGFPSASDICGSGLRGGYLNRCLVSVMVYLRWRLGSQLHWILRRFFNIKEFFRLGRVLRTTLPTGKGGVVHLFVVYGFQGAEEDPDQLLLADKLLQAVLAEAQVVCIGQPLLIAGDLNADPAVIPCLAKDISAGRYVDLAFAYSLGAGLTHDVTRRFNREGGLCWLSQCSCCFSVLLCYCSVVWHRTVPELLGPRVNLTYRWVTQQVKVPKLEQWTFEQLQVVDVLAFAGASAFERVQVVDGLAGGQDRAQQPFCWAVTVAG